MLQIYTIGEDVLRKSCSPVEEVNEDIIDLAHTMLEKMYTDDGLGLAAPQVGVEKRIFVCHVQNDQARIFINPQLIGTSQEQSSYEEGCLSIPGVYADVTRPSSISVQALNERGRPFNLEAHGMLARVILHEMDHLKGVLFIDHLEEKRREKLLKAYNKE
ncbi:MAG: peptide deformylase [Spirochaetaceae bacterium]